ncbi:hypothetical protein FSP39_020094 [Pinctada imbricata]|uniref:Uncharacterized protein n=1 Tax=Pinctada imbricata TaxID=66713 RepID=A0AA89BZS3_PINIB|nr:hypothetical protein FSP39_020094 [Pinctada imbricata]
MGCSAGTMGASDPTAQGHQSGYGHHNQGHHQQSGDSDPTAQSGYGHHNQGQHQQPGYEHNSQGHHQQSGHNMNDQDSHNQQGHANLQQQNVQQQQALLHAQQQQHIQQHQQQQSVPSDGTLDAQVAVSRDLLDNENEESMKGRLSQYGPFAATYSLREMLDYNTEHSNPWEMILFRYHKKIVSAAAMKDLVRPEVKKAELEFVARANSYEMEYYRPHDFRWFAPIYQLSHVGLKISLIKRYVEKCIVADLKVTTEEEYWSDVRQDVLTVISEIDRAPEIMFSDEYLQELKEVYQRFLEKYDRTNGNPDSRDPVSGDPNQAPFPLDHPFSEHPELLRAWTETWETFDTEVPEKEWDPWCYKEKFEDIPKPEEVLVRTYLDDLPPLNHEIDGEAAWEVIEVDLFKNDVTTPEQDNIWKSRESRPGWDDPKRMEQRRQKIEQYYIAKYEWPESKLEPYRGFCARLQESWDKFQVLCTE